MFLTLTFRTEDLPRRHPFRTALAEIGRTEAARTFELRPLDREGVAALVAMRTGSVPSPGSIASVLERSEGNPLYVEELLAAEAVTDASGMPEQLADSSAPGSTVCRTTPSSCCGSLRSTAPASTPRSWRRSSDCGRDELEAHLREAFDSNVLRQTHGTSSSGTA